MRARRLDLAHLLIFPLLGVIQFESKQVLEFLPNVELVSTLTIVYTPVYRRYALIPIFLFLFLSGHIFLLAAKLMELAPDLFGAK